MYLSGHHSSPDMNVYCTFYDTSSQMPKSAVKSICLTEVANSLSKKRNIHVDNDDLPIKTDGSDPLRKEIIDLSFSRDNKLIAFLISDENNNTQAVIYEWNSHKQKVIASCDFSGASFQITRISFSPKDP